MQRRTKANVVVVVAAVHITYSEEVPAGECRHFCRCSSRAVAQIMRRPRLLRLERNKKGDATEQSGLGERRYISCMHFLEHAACAKHVVSAQHIN